MDYKFGIRVSARERELINMCCEHLIMEHKGIFYEVNIKNRMELEKIIENIENYFLKNGLKRNCEPNSLGSELEDLNDKFILKLQEIN